MCVLSMVIVDKYETWRDRYPGIWEHTWPSIGIEVEQTETPPPPTAQEIEEFRRLLDRAREYDREHNQPDCDEDVKRKLLLDLAERLGVEIDFV